MMSAVGFALVENITYLIQIRQQILDAVPYASEAILNKALWDVAVQRSITSVITHMVCGLTMGFYLSKAKDEKYRIQSPENADQEFVKTSIFRRWKYVFYGIVAATAIHGVYDFNLMIPDNNWKVYFMIINLIFGLVIGNVILKETIRQSKVIHKQKLATNETDTKHNNNKGD